MGRFFINDTLIDEKAITLDPDDLIESNTNTSSHCNYLGREIGNHSYFKGAIDSFKVYLDPDVYVPKTSDQNIDLLETYKIPAILCLAVTSLIILILLLGRRKSPMSE